MARVTVEDCIEKVQNRFDLVMLAAHRARNLSSGAQLTVDRDNDKNPVVALREIADETIDLAEIEDSLVRGLQKHVAVDEFEEDEDVLSAADAYTGELMPPIEGPPVEDEDEFQRPRMTSSEDDEFGDLDDEDGGDESSDGESGDADGGDGPDFSGQDIDEDEG